MPVPEDPTVNEAIAKLILRWDGDVLDYASTRRAVIEVTNGVGVLHLPRGADGPPGLDGEPGPGLAPDVVITYANDALALAALPTDLDDGDRGYCVINDTTNTAFFWNGDEWVTVHEAVGLQGPVGPTVGFSVGTVTTSPSGGSAAVAVDPASTSTNKILNFTIPRGIQGSVGTGVAGPAGDALSAADDVQWPVGGPDDGQVLVWDDDISKAKFATVAFGPVGPYANGPDEFTAINDSAWPQDYKIVSQINIPAQDFIWRPRVHAYCDVQLNGLMARVDLEARLNSATGPVIGRGPGDTVTGVLENYTARVLVPSYEGPTTPETLTGTIAAGATAIIYLVIRRIDTLATFGVKTRKDRATFSVWCDPIPGVF